MGETSTTSRKRVQVRKKRRQQEGRDMDTVNAHRLCRSSPRNRHHVGIHTHIPFLMLVHSHVHAILTTPNNLHATLHQKHIHIPP